MPDLTGSRRQAQLEALELSGEILKNLELSELSLASIALKASRLARLMNDPATQQMFAYEAGGYGTGGQQLPPDRYQLALRAGRRTSGWDSTKWSNDLVWTESIDAIEQRLEAVKSSLPHLRDEPTRRTPSSPPTQRQVVHQSIAQCANYLASRRSLIYDYAAAVHYELRYSGIAEDIFVRLRDRVDRLISSAVPTAVQKLASVYENLESGNEEDWSNAVHSCRRILQDLADNLLPPNDDIRTVQRGGQSIQIRYGPDQYINRLMRYIEEHSLSERFTAIVGSNLGYIGERLDAVFRATQKGSHATVGREEADRFVIYTYLIVGDILSLAN
jgi:hypothetical protein